LLDYMVVKILTFFEKTVCLLLSYIRVALIYIPINSVQGFTFLHTHTQHLLSLIFLRIDTFLRIDVRWYLMVLLIFICLLIVVSEVKHLFRYLSICVSSLKKCLYRYFCCY
jgi:hypothetical protein